ncbi:gastrula zinc finger protein xFG20-1-like [Ctenocephalides felis]|uniref:gastrula zinc finger protein xFG20-1-like n=1 Tax=Ctenocephalides felis TaxID=7515 RepID=UPI000E6E1B0F|nr:gastrula zinc finger protein xFG20-1-like [Ctenocephalides felis]
MDSDFFCTECQIPFTARSSLYRHMRQKHDKEPRAVYPNACAFCLKTFKFKYLLTHHVSQVHNNIPNPSLAQSSSVSFEDITHLSSSTKTNIKHPSLPTSYTTTCLTSPYNLLSPTSDPLHKHPHVSLSPHPCTSSIKVQIHTPPTPSSPISSKENFTGTPSTKEKLRCPLSACSSFISAPSISDRLHKHFHVSLSPHPCTSSTKVQIHTPPIPSSPISTKENFIGTPSRKSRIRCPLPPCSSVFSRYTGLYDHIEFYHKTTIDYEQFVFQNIKDFELWKTDIERKEFSHYVKCNSGYKSKTDDKTIYFDCHRSYTYDQKPTVRLFTKTSNKTGYACPSRISCTINHNGTVHVEFWKTHMGHSQDIKFISLDKSLKEHIKEKVIRSLKDKNRQKYRTELKFITLLYIC